MMLGTRPASLVADRAATARGVRRRRGLPLKAGAPSSHPTAAPFGTRHEGVVRARPARHDALNGVFWLPGHFSSLCGRRRQAYCDCERHLPQEKWAGGRRTVCSSAGRRFRPQGQVLRPWRTGFERGRLPYFPRKAAQVATQRIFADSRAQGRRVWYRAAPGGVRALVGGRPRVFRGRLRAGEHILPC